MRLLFLPPMPNWQSGWIVSRNVMDIRLRSCLEMIEKLFEVKFLHFLSEASGQIGTAIFPEAPVESEVFSTQTFRQ